MKRGFIGRLFPLMFSKVVCGVSYCSFFKNRLTRPQKSVILYIVSKS